MSHQEIQSLATITAMWQGNSENIQILHIDIVTVLYQV